MTEAEWLDCSDPLPVLEACQETASERKLRLLVTAAARSLWSDDGPAEVIEAVEAAERFADGHIGASALKHHRHALPRGVRRAAAEQDEWYRARGNGLALMAAFGALSLTRQWALQLARGVWRAFISDFGPPLTHSLRCIFGNPFRPASCDARWRTDTALSLAKRMYDGRNFSLMPILADALQDAGCEDEGILNHCRSGGVHVRDCWVVDLLLGKE